MAEVTLDIGGRSYDVTCRDGEEEHLRDIAKLVDACAAKARAAVGGVNEVRQLLFAALLLADELNDIRTTGVVKPAADDSIAAAVPDAAVVAAIERLASRVESFADRLEQDGPNT